MKGELCLIVLYSVFVLASCVPVKLKTNVIYVKDENYTSALFRCSAGQGHLFYLNHMITWSKRGRDGKEHYLSLNWNRVQEGLKPVYGVSSQVFNEGSSTNETGTPEMYFVLVKSSLTSEDHGDFICRLHDFNRNVMAESVVPIIVFDEGLALSPYRIIGEINKDVAVNCMTNTSVSKDSHLVIYHVTKDGNSTKVVDGGKIVESNLEKKYDFVTRDNGDRIIHNVLTIKAPSKFDEGHIVCELRNGSDINGSDIITSTNASIAISVPKLIVSPPYYLKVPENAVGHFQCACALMDTAACIEIDMVWTFHNKTTGNKTTIYQNGTLLDKSGMHETILVQNGSAINLTVNGLKYDENEGEYICSLEDKLSGTEIAYASIPVSATPISLGAVALLDNYPTSIRLLCTMSGSMWDNQYFDDHKLSWVHRKDGVSKTIASNNVVQPENDAKKFEVLFDSHRYYSILTIKDVLKSDYGDYICQLTNNYSSTVLEDAYLKMYGPGNITIFSSMNN